VDSIPILQTPAPQPAKGLADTGQSPPSGASFLALIEGFLGPAGEQAPPATESPETEAGTGRSEGMASLVPPGLLLETATDAATSLAGGLALQPPQPAGEDLPAGDGETDDGKSADGTDGTDGQDMKDGAPAASGDEPPFPTARGDSPPAGTGADGARPVVPPSPAAAPAPTAERTAAAPESAPESAAKTDATGAASTAANASAKAAAPATAPAADPTEGGPAVAEAPPAEGVAQTQVAAVPRNGGGSGTDGGSGHDGGHTAGRPDPKDAVQPRDIPREETESGSARSAGISDGSAGPQQDAAPGRTPHGPASPAAESAARPPATDLPAPAPVPPAGDAGAEGMATAAAGAVRLAGEPAAGAPAAGSPPSAGHGPATPPHPASQMVSVTLSRMADGRAERMTIQLRPAELGTVEVKLDFRGDGTVQAMIVADRAETLGLLQRDAPTLEKALQEAGLKTAPQGLSFSLRDGRDGERNFAGFHQAFARTRSRGGPVADDGARPLTLVAGPGAKTAPGRVDIRI
jgi:flagellar hook-length control protein FliK